MNDQTHSPYSGITPEELHIAIRRAHAERAKAIREMFSALNSWLARLGERRPRTSAQLRTAAGR